MRELPENIKDLRTKLEKPIPGLNVNSITRVKHGVQVRNIKLTGDKRNPASFCGCHKFSGIITCSPLPFIKGDQFISTNLRIAVLPPDANGFRRPIYKTIKWRPKCLSQILEATSDIYYQRWFLLEAEKERHRVEKKPSRYKKKENPKPPGRPKLNLTIEQRNLRSKLQRMIPTYKIRAKQALDKGNVDLFRIRIERVELMKKMIEAQTTTKPFEHDPLFDPNTVEVTSASNEGG